jgi:hypothetical protein
VSTRPQTQTRHHNLIKVKARVATRNNINHNNNNNNNITIIRIINKRSRRTEAPRLL